MVTDLQICSLSDHPEGSAGNAAFPDAAPINATGWSNDNSVNYDRALFSSTIIWSPGRRLKVAELTGDLSRVRLFHPSGTRANASWVRSLRTWTASSSIPLFCPLICQVRHTLLVM
jgi:hypothetical protein